MRKPHLSACCLFEGISILALLKNEGEKRFPSVSDIGNIGEITAISTYALYQKIEGELLLQSFKTHFIERMTALLLGRKCGMLPVQHFIFWRSMEKFSLNFDFDRVGTSISPLKVSYVYTRDMPPWLFDRYMRQWDATVVWRRSWRSCLWPAQHSNSKYIQK